MCLLASVGEGTYVYVVDEDIVLPVRAAGWRCSSRHETGVVAYRRLGHVPVLIQLMALRTRLCSRLMGLMSVGKSSACTIVVGYTASFTWTP